MCLHLTSLLQLQAHLESRIATLGLEKNGEDLRTFTGDWFTTCMCLYDLTMHFQVIDVSSECNLIISSRDFSSDIANLQRKKRCIAGFEICLEDH